MIRYFLLFLIACCTLIQPALAGRPFLAIVGWGNVGDPDGDCSIGIKDGSMTFGIPGTPHDYAADLQSWNAPRIMCTVRADFIAQVKVTGTFDPKGPSTIDGGKPYNGAGILIVADAQNHVTLQRAAILEDDHVRHYLNFQLRKDGKCVATRGDIDLNNGEDVYLRIERHGNKFFGSSSSDGATWHSYEPLEASFPKNLDVGVEVVNSSADSFNCAFAEYQLFRSSSGTMWDPKGTDEPEQTSQAPDAGAHNGKSASSALPKQAHRAGKPVVADSKEKAKTETAANNN
jgi:regulation of enolase protein 1 (concanavalin A-like superfamily)